MVLVPVGQRIRKRRQTLGVSQSRLANSIGISPSYLNLIEHNKRAIGGALLNRLAEAIGLDSRALAGTEEARLIAELGEVADDAALAGGGMSADDAREIVATSPTAARAILSLFRAYREARQRSDLLGERLSEDSFLAEASQQILALITTIRSYAEILKDYGDLTEAERGQFVDTLVGESEALAARAGDMFDFMGGRGARRPRPSPREEIEDFVSDNANYFPRLEAAADATLADEGGNASYDTLAARLARRQGITIAFAPPETLPVSGEHLSDKVFRLSDRLSRVSQRFRLARLVGLLDWRDLLGEIVADGDLSSADGEARLRRALASYFAAALLMPYDKFHAAADACRMDIARLGNRFDASFEQVCHRLTTLRRPGAEGVPLHFLRTDIAGNISKRFTASGFRLPRYGGACPRWIVHHAFTTPGRIVTQVAAMPDGDAYFLVARATGPEAGPNGALRAVMIGAAIEHAGRFVYADNLDLDAAGLATPIGVTCRQCSREDCTERAFERVSVATAAPAILR